MLLFLLKLLLTPLLVGLVSFAGKHWGPSISGWLVGLPLTSGPVALYLALELGRTFAAKAALGTITGLLSVVAFCLTYTWLSFRLKWPVCILVSWGAFFCVTAILQYVVLPVFSAFLVVIFMLAITLRVLPTEVQKYAPVKPASWDTPLRMIVATAFVLVLTSSAHVLGPRLSGLLAPFPIYATILSVFTHQVQGSSSARRVLRGLIAGIFSFALFFLVIAELIQPLGIVLSFILATFAALLLHGCSLYILRRYAMTA